VQGTRNRESRVKAGETQWTRYWGIKMLHSSEWTKFRLKLITRLTKTQCREQ
jgi:hypothetical protein